MHFEILVYYFITVVSLPQINESIAPIGLGNSKTFTGTTFCVFVGIKASISLYVRSHNRRHRYRFGPDSSAGSFDALTMQTNVNNLIRVRTSSLYTVSYAFNRRLDRYLPFLYRFCNFTAN